MSQGRQLGLKHRVGRFDSYTVCKQIKIKIMKDELIKATIEAIILNLKLIKQNKLTVDDLIKTLESLVDESK
jgi:hypothetical protein